MTNQKEETSRLLSRASKDFTNHIFRSQFFVVGVERRSDDDFVDVVAVDVDGSDGSAKIFARLVSYKICDILVKMPGPVIKKDAARRAVGEAVRTDSYRPQ